jgi:hypothetical protein
MQNLIDESSKPKSDLPNTKVDIASKLLSSQNAQEKVRDEQISKDFLM